MATKIQRRVVIPFRLVLDLFILISFVHFLFPCGGKAIHHFGAPTYGHSKALTTESHRHIHKESDDTLSPTDRDESCCDLPETNILPALAYQQISGSQLKFKSKLLKWSAEKIECDFSLEMQQQIFATTTYPKRKTLAIHISSTILRI